MLYNNLVKNYDDFKSLFVREDKSRKNGILLSLVKARTHGKLRDYIKENSRLVKGNVLREHNGKYTVSSYVAMEPKAKAIYNANSMVGIECILNAVFRPRSIRSNVNLNSINFFAFIPTKDYTTDGRNGVCVSEEDRNKIRYVKMVNGEERAFCMKPGKYLNKIGENFPAYMALPLQVQRYLQETFAARWTSAMGNIEGYTLHVDDDFRGIYSSNRCDGNLHSCMTDCDYYTFYENIDASAAYITDENDLIVARCIIYNNVHVKDEDKTYRLAERQYSTGCDDKLKKILVDKLIAEGYIDGYKKIGADCRSPFSFILNNGTEFGKTMWIDLNIDSPYYHSYQDSFKYYNIDECVAYNDPNMPYQITLESTDGQAEDFNYDSYHEYDTPNDVVTVHVFNTRNGCWFTETCDEENLDDFVEIDDEYYEEEYVNRCPICGEYFVGDDFYSELTEENYCCYSCMEGEEEKYKKEHWYYSEIDDEYFENENDVVSVWEWNEDEDDYGYSLTTIYRVHLRLRMYYKNAICYNGTYYLKNNIGNCVINPDDKCFECA